MDWNSILTKGLPFILLGYLIGSIPTSYTIVRLKTGYDLSKLGTGNLGARNLGRLLGVRWFIIAMTLDFAKGLIPTLLALQYGLGGVHYFTGFAAVLGHNFSVYIGFRGGRGMATAAGALAILSPVTLTFCLLVGLITLLFEKRVVLVNIVMTLTILPFFLLSAWLKYSWVTALRRPWLSFVLASGEENYLCFAFALLVATTILAAHMRDITIRKRGLEEKMVQDMEKAREEYRARLEAKRRKL